MKTFFIWMQHDEGWKAMLAFVYAVICIFDFIVVPAWIGLTRAAIDFDLTMQSLVALDPSVQIRIIEAMTFQHQPFTLQGAGLFHLAFGALLTGSAISRFKGDSK